MNEQPFDVFAKAFARGQLSRRQVLAAAAASAVGAALPNSPARASATKMATSLICQSSNVISVPCELLREYALQCGVVCPNGTRRLGANGCTVANLNQSAPTPTDYREYRDGKLACAEVRLTWSWTANPQ